VFREVVGDLPLGLVSELGPDDDRDRQMSLPGTPEGAG
jgi:hypothetical protein